MRRNNNINNNNNNNNNNLKSFQYKTKFVGNTVPDGVNGILRNETIAVPLKYLSNFRRSLEMSLINWKIELKFKWTSVLSASGADNTDSNRNDNISTIKDTKLYVPVVTLLKDNQKL